MCLCGSKEKYDEMSHEETFLTQEDDYKRFGLRVTRYRNP